MNEKMQTAVEVFEHELRNKLCRQNDEDFMFSDLTGLYIDIISVITQTNKSKAGIIYDYAKLLEQELQLYSGADAYIAGQKAKDKPENEVLNAYILGIMETEDGKRLDRRIQACFDEITGLLGDKSGLLTDFTDTYNKVHGIIKNNISEFISMGQSSGLAVTA